MRLLVDENFHGDILRGLLRVEPKQEVLVVLLTSEPAELANRIIFIPLSCPPSTRT